MNAGRARQVQGRGRGPQGESVAVPCRVCDAGVDSGGAPLLIMQADLAKANAEIERLKVCCGSCVSICVGL